MADKEFDFTIIDELGILSTSPKGWSKELNLISWNGREPKYDIRDWAPDHGKMSKGITLTEEEMKRLVDSFAQSSSSGELNKANIEKSMKQQKHQIISVDELINSWDKYTNSAPDTIREYLLSSHLNKANENTLIVILKKGDAFNKLSDQKNKEDLKDFISRLLGERINIELLESSWL